MPREITRIEVPEPEPMHPTPEGGAETQGVAYRLTAPAVATEPLTVTAPDGTALTWVPTELVYRDETGQYDYIVGSAPATVEARDREARYRRTFPAADDVFRAEPERVKHWVILHEPPRAPAEYLSGRIEFGVTGLVSGVELPEGRHDEIEAGPFRLPKPMARDLAGREIEGYYEVLSAEEGQQLFVWFPAEAVRAATYPVMIDPTVATTTTAYGTHTLGAGIARAADGSWFLLVHTPAIAVYRSTDGGQTWSNTNFPANWGSNAASNGRTATICATDDGRVHVIWIDGADLSVIYHAYYASGQWTSPAVAIDWPYEVRQVVSCGGPSGVVHLAFVDYVSSQYGPMYMRFSGTWGTPQAFDSYPYPISVMIGASGSTIIILWIDAQWSPNQSREFMGRLSTDGGATFYSLNGWLAACTWPPSMFRAPDGTLYVVYDDAGALYVRPWNSAQGWQTAEAIPGATGTTWAKGFATPAALVVAWTSGTPSKVWCATKRDGAWGAASQVASSSQSQRYVSVPQSGVDAGSPVAWTEGDASPYAVVSGVISVAQPPNAPILGSRSTFDATEAATFTWQFSDADAGDSQSAYQLLIKRASDGAVVYDTGKVASSAGEHTVPGGTLQNGVQYRWTVRTWDSLDQVGPYATEETFLTSARPTVTITDPASDGATVATSDYTVRWSVSDPESKGQSAYRVVLKQGSTVVHDSGQVQSTSARAYTLTGLQNNTSYAIEVTAWDGDGVASQPATRTIQVQYTPPPEPTVTVEGLGGRVRLRIDNHNSGAEIPAERNDVYRRRAGEAGNGLRIATGVAPDGVIEDYAVASGVAYEYRVVAIGGNGTSTASVWTPSPILTMKGAWLHDPSDPAGTVRSYRVAAQPERGEDWEPERALLQFAGRTYPVAEFGEHEDRLVRCSILVLPDRLDDLDALRSLAARRSVVCYRDSAGRRIYGVLGPLRIRDERHGGYTVDLEITAVDYDEAV